MHRKGIFKKYTFFRNNLFNRISFWTMPQWAQHRPNEQAAYFLGGSLLASCVCSYSCSFFQAGYSFNKSTNVPREPCPNLAHKQRHLVICGCKIGVKNVLFVFTFLSTWIKTSMWSPISNNFRHVSIYVRTVLITIIKRDVLYLNSNAVLEFRIT